MVIDYMISVALNSVLLKHLFSLTRKALVTENISFTL